jgi:hypothetical protein
MSAASWTRHQTCAAAVDGCAVCFDWTQHRACAAVDGRAFIFDWTQHRACAAAVTVISDGCAVSFGWTQHRSCAAAVETPGLCAMLFVPVRMPCQACAAAGGRAVGIHYAHAHSVWAQQTPWVLVDTFAAACWLLLFVLLCWHRQQVRPHGHPVLHSTIAVPAAAGRLQDMQMLGIATEYRLVLSLDCLWS